MFYTFQSVSYYHPKIDNEICIRLLRGIIEKVNAKKEIKIVPFNKKNKTILDTADPSLLAEQGGMIILKEIKRVKHYNLKEINFNCYVINEYNNCTLIKIDPILSIVEKSTAMEVFLILKQLLLLLINEIPPMLVQLNGLGEEEEEGVLDPKKLKTQTLPSLFAPFNYLDKSLVSENEIAHLAPIADVSSHANGYTVEFDLARPKEEINFFLSNWQKGKMKISYSSILP